MELELLVKKKKKKIYFRVWKVVDVLKNLSFDFIAPQLKLEAAGCLQEMQTCNFHSRSSQSQCSSLTINMSGCMWNFCIKEERRIAAHGASHGSRRRKLKSLKKNLDENSERNAILS